MRVPNLGERLVVAQSVRTLERDLDDLSKEPQLPRPVESDGRLYFSDMTLRRRGRMPTVGCVNRRCSRPSGLIRALLCIRIPGAGFPRQTRFVGRVATTHPAREYRAHAASILRACAPHRYSGPHGGFHSDISLSIGATGSHVPHKSLKQVHVAFMPDAV